MTCAKTSFSKNSINGVLQRMLKRGVRMRAYICEHCGAYHLTSNLYEHDGFRKEKVYTHRKGKHKKKQYLLQ